MSCGLACYTAFSVNSFARTSYIGYLNGMDVLTSEARRRNMQAIRAKDTKPEMLVRRYLHKMGLRYRLHDGNLPGKPDVVLPKYKTVVFVHGCFWHMHECDLFRFPKTRSDWWRNKLRNNRERDERCVAELEALGWNVIVVWECELKGANRDSVLAGIYRRIVENG